MKYDKIVEISKERSRQNTEVALRAIEEMLREGEWITVAELAKRTKLSRANFYVNKDIRKSLDDARYRQQRMLKINFDSVMEIEDLQQKLRKLNLEMVKLRVESSLDISITLILEGFLIFSFFLSNSNRNNLLSIL